MDFNTYQAKRDPAVLASAFHTLNPCCPCNNASALDKYDEESVTNEAPPMIGATMMDSKF